MIRIALLVAIILIFAKPSFASSVVLNELMIHPGSGDDWIEIYNPTSSTVDLSNWTLVDSTSTMKTLSGNLSSGGFVAVDVSNRLNNSGDSVYLKDSSGSTIDSHSYSSNPGTDKSLGRSPDGDAWGTLTSTSKGSTNGSTSSSPSPSPSASASTSSFSISNAPSSIDSTQTFSVKVSLSLPDDPNTLLYLKGAFKKDGSSNYFGQTKVGSTFIKNGSSYSNQYKITTDSSGNWSGDLDIQPDILDAGYLGTGNYIFKVGRYTSSGSGPTWSNEVNITINAKEITAAEDERVMGISNLSKSPTPKTSTSKKTSEEDLPKEVYALENYRKVSSPSSTSSPVPETKTLGESSTNYLNIFLIIGGLILIIGPIIWYIRFHDKNNI